MTRPPDLPGHYRIERELNLVMNPEPASPPLPIKDVGYFLLMFPVGLGILMGTLTGCALAPVIWVCRKMWGRR